MLMMKQGKKKMRPLLAIGVGAMAIYGAYSVVKCVKETCCEKAKMLTKVIKKKEKEKKNSECDDCFDA
ncbi:MAG: hypothetical protein E7673_01850 [Ruminococcaceae bacterium]|nr:hypothetical protein [Oscillospiraceae bacterium]